MANGRIVLYEEHALSGAQRRSSPTRPAFATRLRPGTIGIDAVPLDRCRICGSNTAQLVNARKRSWECSTCGEKYRL